MKLKRLLTFGAIASAGATLVLVRMVSRRFGGARVAVVPAQERNGWADESRGSQQEEKLDSRETEAQRLKPFTRVLIAIASVLIIVSMLDLILRGPRQYPVDPTWSVRGGDAEIGRQAVVRHGCGACHVIPGITTARGRVGPQLNDFRIQTYIGGVLPNTPENLVAWIQNPRAASPRTAMPNLGISEEEASHIAAYIYSATARQRFLRTQSQ